jgi:hypothetical protein
MAALTLPPGKRDWLRASFPFENQKTNLPCFFLRFTGARSWKYQENAAGVFFFFFRKIPRSYGFNRPSLLTGSLLPACKEIRMEFLPQQGYKEVDQTPSFGFSWGNRRNLFSGESHHSITLTCVWAAFNSKCRKHLLYAFGIPWPSFRGAHMAEKTKKW